MTQGRTGLRAKIGITLVIKRQCTHFTDAFTMLKKQVVRSLNFHKSPWHRAWEFNRSITKRTFFEQEPFQYFSSIFWCRNQDVKIEEGMWKRENHALKEGCQSLGLLLCASYVFLLRSQPSSVASEPGYASVEELEFRPSPVGKTGSVYLWHDYQHDKNT